MALWGRELSRLWGMSQTPFTGTKRAICRKTKGRNECKTASNMSSLISLNRVGLGGGGGHERIILSGWCGRGEGGREGG